MTLAGALFATCDYHIIFWHAEGKLLRWTLSLLTFLISPFHSWILLIKSYQIELKLRATPDSKALKEKWDLFNYHICNHTKIELGLETIFQLTLQVILVLFAKSKTRTTDELTQIFNAELSFLLVASIAWSFISNVKAHITGLSAKRIRFPVKSKIIVACFAFFGTTSKVMGLVSFFTPPLGLFDVLGHWQGEQSQWQPSFIEAYVMNKTITFDGHPPIAVETIFKQRGRIV